MAPVVRAARRAARCRYPRDGDLSGLVRAGSRDRNRPNAPLRCRPRRQPTLRPLDTLGGKLYEGACASCHSETGPTLFGVRPALALNTNVHAADPDNLIRVILDGIPSPAAAELGDMPGFRHSFDDNQIAALVRYLRASFAPQAPAWGGVEQAVARLRAHQGSH